MRSYRKATRRLGHIERSIMEDLSGGDLLYGFLLSGRSTRRMYKLARERARARYQRKMAIERLVHDELISHIAGRLSITKSGRSALGTTILSTAKRLHTKWDGKWRVVIFDIPESYASVRNRIRTILRRAGFVQLQQSVWIFPHECDELARLIKEESRLSRHILYGTLECVESDDALKKRFGLP